MPNGKNVLYLLPLILFFFLVASELVERSMYTDGVAYAGLSENLANGIGTFWNPKLSEVHHFSFHEHPPLVFGIQSLFFRVSGDGIVTERIYALTIFLLNALLMIFLWRESLREWPEWRRLWFLPLTLWLANEVVYHFYPANVLEPTMTLFTLGSVWCCLRSIRAGALVQGLLVVAAGLLLFAGTLCKGFVALFPLAFFGIHWLVFHRISLLRAISLSLLLGGVISLSYLFLLQDDTAHTALTKYFDSQVLASLNSERTYEDHHRENRLYIIGRTFEILLPALILCALVTGIAYRKMGRGLLTGAHLPHAALFLLLGVAASFPLAISPKQSFYYLLPSMAYFAPGLGLLIVPAVAHWFSRPLTPKASKLLSGALLVLLMVAIGNTVRHWGQITRRDTVVLTDIEAMNQVIPKGATIGSQGDIDELVSYFYRTHRVSVDTAVGRRFAYGYLVAHKDEVVEGYEGEPLELKRYVLYRFGK